MEGQEKTSSSIGARYWFTQEQNSFLKRVASKSGMEDKGQNSDVKMLIDRALKLYVKCQKISPDGKSIVVLGLNGQEKVDLV